MMLNEESLLGHTCLEDKKPWREIKTAPTTITTLSAEENAERGDGGHGYRGSLLAVVGTFPLARCEVLR